MLHELVHNVQGPHDAIFYKLLDEITEVSATVRDISFHTRSAAGDLVLFIQQTHQDVLRQHGVAYSWVSSQ